MIHADRSLMIEVTLVTRIECPGFLDRHIIHKCVQDAEFLQNHSCPIGCGLAFAN